MRQILAAAITVASLAGTPTPAMAQSGWTTMLLPGGVSAARTVLGLGGAPDRVEEFLLADFTQQFYGTGSTAPEVNTFRRYVALLEQLSREAATWPAGFALPGDTTSRADRDRAKRFLELLGLTPGSNNTVAAGKSSEARERQAWLLAAGINPLEMLEPLNGGASVAVTIPQGELPLPLPDFWKTVDARQSALLTVAGSRQSALFYTGLLSLDSQTLVYLTTKPALGSQLRTRFAAEFAAFAHALQIHDGRVVPAGGEQAAAMWEKLAGASLSSPETFIPALLSVDAGRLAWFYEIVARLDTDRRASVLANGPDVYGVIRRVATKWKVANQPFSRPSPDPLTALSELHITDNDASSLLSWLFAREDEAGARFEACRVAQRLAAQTNCAAAADLSALVEAAVHMPVLLPTLERLGITDASVITATIRAARQFNDRGKGDALDPLAHWQLMLALIEQVAVRQRFEPARITSLVRSWAEAASAPGSNDDGRAGAWLVDVLLPALAADVTVEDLELYERDVIVGFSKRGVEAPDQVKVFWEGIEYIVDDTFATTRDVLTIRVSQHSPTLGDVVRLRAVLRTLESGVRDLAQVAEISADVTRIMAATAKLRERDGNEQKIAGEFRKVDKTIREISSDRQLSDATAQIAPMREALDALLEGALLPLVYALAVSPAGVSPSTLLELPHWHTWEKAAWLPARREIGPFMESVVTGSVIGLDIAMAKSRLRASGRATAEPEPAKDEGEDDRRVALLQSMRIHSEDSTWVADAPRILKAIAAGDAVIASNDAIPADMEARMRSAGIDADRIGMVRWQRERGVPANRQAFTRLDAYRLGTNDPLPAGWRASDSMTEMMLRLLDGTQSWRLPAGVVPALVPLAAHDWLVHARPVTRERVEAYMLGLVSARLLMRPVRSQHP